MSDEKMKGRLVVDGETGRLYLHPVDDDGVVLDAIHKVNEDGTNTKDLIDGMTEVRWSHEINDFVKVGKGDPSHFDVHHERFVTINGTSGPLYDQNGKLVFAGDPHHFEPTPDDPHFDPSAPNKTKTVTLPDEISSMATGHTEAYTS
jgi:hypothetical protein